MSLQTTCLVIRWEVVLLLERGLNKMAVMSKKLNLGFEVAPEKQEQFLKRAASTRACADAMTRAKKNIPGFEKREVKRK